MKVCKVNLPRAAWFGSWHELFIQDFFWRRRKWKGKILLETSNKPLFCHHLLPLMLSCLNLHSGTQKQISWVILLKCFWIHYKLHFFKTSPCMFHGRKTDKTMPLKPLTSFSFCSAQSLSLRALSAAFTSCFSPGEKLPRTPTSHELWGWQKPNAFCNFINHDRKYDLKNSGKLQSWLSALTSLLDAPSSSSPSLSLLLMKQSWRFLGLLNLFET